jgi:hypothetical protein
MGGFLLNYGICKRGAKSVLIPLQWSAFLPPRIPRFGDEEVHDFQHAFVAASHSTRGNVLAIHYD